MNAPASLSKILVRTETLSDPSVCAEIETYVLGKAEGTPFHLPQWLVAVEEGCGQPARMMVARQHGRIVGILPLHEVHSTLFGRALVSSGFAVSGGILCDTDSAGEELARAALHTAERLSFPEIELRGGFLPDGWERRSGVYANFSRPLEKDEENQLLSIKTQTPRRSAQGTAKRADI